MLRTRILSVATAAVLMLGVSVGGAGAAFAEADEALPVVDQTSVVESPAEPAAEPAPEPVAEPAPEPAVEPAPEPVVEPEPEPVVEPAAETGDAPAAREVSGTPVTSGVVPAGITVTVDGPNPFTCNSSPRNYEKPDSWNTSDNAGVTEAWGTATWSENGSFSWTINPGYDVNLCIKGGQTIVEIDTSVFSGSSYAFKTEQGFGISHAGFKVVSEPTRVTPSASVEQISCVDEELVGGVITVDLTKQGVTYTIEDSNGDPVAFDAVTGKTGMLPPGTYTVFGVDGDATDAFVVSNYEKDFTIDEFSEECGGDEPTPVTPSASVEQISCVDEELVGGVITVDLTKQGVTYTIEDSNGDPVAFDAVTGKTGMLPPGTYTVFGVDADATDEFVVSNYEEDFTIDRFTDDCGGELGGVVVPKVDKTDFCEGVGPNALRVATFTVTDVDNVTYQYKVNDGPAVDVDFDGQPSVTYTVKPLDKVEVLATPAEGFELPEGWSWTHTFNGAAFCPGTFPTTVAAADITPADCDGNPVEVSLSNEGGVIWTLNGKVVAGNDTHTLPAGSAIVLTAALEEDYTWNDADQQTLWTADGLSEEDCLSSLAFTGSSSATEWIGAAAALMMIAGMGFVIRRRLIVG